MRPNQHHQLILPSTAAQALSSLPVLTRSLLAPSPNNRPSSQHGPNDQMRRQWGSLPDFGGNPRPSSRRRQYSSTPNHCPMDSRQPEPSYMEGSLSEGDLGTGCLPPAPCQACSPEWVKISPLAFLPPLLENRRDQALGPLHIPLRSPPRQ